jgi:hypothetical protein
MPKPIFWMVVGKGGPSQRHYTKQAAITEAERLAKKQNEDFYVLEAIGYIEAIEVITKFNAMEQAE